MDAAETTLSRQSLCVTCLSQDRKLFPVDDSKSHSLILNLCEGDQICWECNFFLLKLADFQSRAARAQALLAGALQNPTNVTEIKSFSNLKMSPVYLEVILETPEISIKTEDTIKEECENKFDEYTEGPDTKDYVYCDVSIEEDSLLIASNEHTEVKGDEGDCSEEMDDVDVADASLKNGMDDDQSQPKKKNRKYSEATLRLAIGNVLNSNMTLYRASKEYKIPWTTLKENLERVKDKSSSSNTQVTVTKMGRPYALSVDVEHQLVSYIIKMQELGFGLTVNTIRQLAYTLAEAVGQKHRFNSEKKCAGWSWWVNFKERFGLSLRTPKNLSAGRAICSSPAILGDFYDKLETALVQHGLMDRPERIWNCDETGLTFVNKPNKVVTKMGKKYIYNRTYAEKGTTTTVLACINATGSFIPPMVIFKGVRNIPKLCNGSLPNSLTRLSPKGWINASLFLEWLKFFAASIPPARPVMLIMDSHASHVSPSVLDYARSEQIILFTMPAHTSHLLQPLDVGVFRPLKVAWREELQNYKYINPTSTPTRFDFHNFFTPAFDKSFTASNVRAGFRRTGIYPLNKNAICPEAIAPSEVTDKPLPLEETTLQAAESEALKDPNQTFEVTSYNAQVCNKFVMECDAHQVAAPSTTSPGQHQLEWLAGSNGPSTSSSVHSSQMEASISMSGSQITGISVPKIHKKDNIKTRAILSPRKKITKSAVKQKVVSNTKRTTHKRQQKEQKEDDDWICNSCGGRYSISQKNGSDWITCSFCFKPYHLHCQGQVIDKNQAVFMCDLCSLDPDDSDSDF